jgi:hypothetical protein
MLHGTQEMIYRRQRTSRATRRKTWIGGATALADVFHRLVHALQRDVHAQRILCSPSLVLTRFLVVFVSVSGIVTAKHAGSCASCQKKEYSAQFWRSTKIIHEVDATALGVCTGYTGPCAPGVACHNVSPNAPRLVAMPLASTVRLCCNSGDESTVAFERVVRWSWRLGRCSPFDYVVTISRHLRIKKLLVLASTISSRADWEGKTTKRVHAPYTLAPDVAAGSSIPTASFVPG